MLTVIVYQIVLVDAIYSLYTVYIKYSFLNYQLVFTELHLQAVAYSMPQQTIPNI